MSQREIRLLVRRVQFPFQDERVFNRLVLLPLSTNQVSGYDIDRKTDYGN